MLTNFNRGRHVIIMKTKKGDKEKLREKILADCSSLIQERGISGSGINAIMAQIGLTTGALYSHFSSKDQLIAEVISTRIEVLKQTIWMVRDNQRIPQEKKLTKWTDAYLSKEHIDSIGSGCVVSALLSDLQKCSKEIQESFLKKIQEFYEELRSIYPNPEKTSIQQVMILFAFLVGALNLLRIHSGGQNTANLIVLFKKQLAHILNEA